MRNHHSEQNQFQCIYGRLTFVLRRDLRNHKPVPKGWFCCVHRSNMTKACWINMRYSVVSSDEAQNHCCCQTCREIFKCDMFAVWAAGRLNSSTRLFRRRETWFWSCKLVLVCAQKVHRNWEIQIEDLCFQTELKHLILSEPSQSVDTPSSSSSCSDRSSVSPAHSNTHGAAVCCRQELHWRTLDV